MELSKILNLLCSFDAREVPSTLKEDGKVQVKVNEQVFFICSCFTIAEYQYTFYTDYNKRHTSKVS